VTADREAFVATYGPLFEHSPWVAEDAYDRGPYADREALYEGLVAAMHAAPEDKQVALVRAHPELAGKVATVDSEREQSSAGLDRLERDEYETLVSANAAYREKFGFPFVICVRDHDKASILEAAEARVRNDPATELRTALAEIARIAHHRLEALPA
jgi:2-oxo-4-hydroxy-4-carboxy-5-ureidoimidazoline decarboxylase